MPSNLTRKELRDYYAAEAMNGLVAGMPERFVKNAKDFAQRAFDIADAMLEESDRSRTVARPAPRPTGAVRYSAMSAGAAGSQGTPALPAQATN